MVLHTNLFLCLVFLNFSLVWCTLSKSDRKKSNGHKKQTLNGPVENLPESIFITEKIKYKDVLKEASSFSISQSIVRHIDHDVLGYVTPWNNHGYNVAKNFALKFTMISPVWFQLKPKNRGGVKFEGLQDIDKNWILTLKDINSKLKIVPRVIFESWTYPSMKSLLTSESAQRDFSKELIEFAQKNDFDGFILEIWSLLGGEMKKELTGMLINVAKHLKENDLSFILAIPPTSYFGGRPGMFLRQDFENLVDHLTAFSLMSYDYSNFNSPGPNSPLSWISKCIRDLVPQDNDPNRKKILMGLNFYGNDFSESKGEPIIGEQYLKILERYKPKFNFDNITGEHYFVYRSDQGEDHTVYYPTLFSVYLRILLAKQLGTGIAIWEIGQGLDYFYGIL